VLRETRFAHQALAEITPLRDIFATLFFVSLGMLLSPRFVADNLGLIVITIAVIISIKFLVVFGIVHFFGYSRRIAVLTGAGLFQIGEFGFILAQAGINRGIISDQFYSLILASAIISMILTPLFMNLVSWLYPRLVRAPAGREVIAEDISALPASESSRPISPVIIAGYGRVGQNIAKGLQDAGIPYTVIEIDPSLVYDMRCGGISCIYGDASNAHVLSRVDVNKAKVLAVTFPDPLAVITTVQAALQSNPKLKVVARAHRAKDAELLKGLGVTELISPEYEAGLAFISRILSVFGWKGAEIKRALAEVQQDEEITEFSTEE
jgi:CPA2 family monovalent cation:H+ antiporter-2